MTRGEVKAAAPDEWRPTILIVDDAPENIRLLASSLGEQGRLLFATTGARALELAGGQALDLVLLDIGLPDLDGYEVCRRLRAEERFGDPLVVFISARGEEEDEAQGLDLGAADYLVKPIVPRLVRARMRNLLALRRATLALKAANRELTRLSITDPLTGIANRRHFMDRAAHEHVRFRRTGRVWSLGMIDIDHFKAVNDRLGHDAGDEVLLKLSALWQGRLRQTDLLGRFGGEEFAILLPETPAAGALIVAEDLRRASADHTVRFAGHLISVTVSIGVTVVDGPDDSLEAMLRRADLALYRAKAEGRDRIAFD